jgi:hypothetical protein
MKSWTKRKETDRVWIGAGHQYAFKHQEGGRRYEVSIGKYAGGWKVSIDSADQGEGFSGMACEGCGKPVTEFWYGNPSILDRLLADPGDLPSKVISMLEGFQRRIQAGWSEEPEPEELVL